MICYRSDVSRLEAEEENVATATLPLGAGGRCRSNNIEAKFKGYKVVVGLRHVYQLPISATFSTF